MIATASKPKVERAKRARTFFKSKEIAHQWAHQLVPYAKSPGNMSFQGLNFISYNTVIARVIVGAKGRRGYALNTTRYSPSTSQHQSEARAAIPQGATVFRMEGSRSGYCSGGYFDPTPKSLVSYYHRESLSEFKLGEDVKSRTRTRSYHEAVVNRDLARSVDKFFGTKHASDVSWTHLRNIAKKIAVAAPLDLALQEKKRLSDEKRAASIVSNRIARAEEFIASPETVPAPPWRDLWNLPSDVRARVEAAMPAHEQAREAQRTAFVLDLAMRYITDPASNEAPADIMRLPEDIRAQVAAASERKHRLTIEAWQRGELVRLPRDVPTMLRVERDPNNRDRLCSSMETSLGVTVPLADAERAFKFISAIRKGRGDWHRNGETFAIGDFQLDAVNPQGVVAGCHRVTWAEVDRFSAAMGWVLPVVT